MSRLEEIKNEFAKEQGYKTWEDYTRFLEYGISDHVFSEIANRYARECCIATQKACANQESLNKVIYECVESRDCLDEMQISHDVIDFITKTDNIVLL